MREFQEKRKIRKLMYSKLSIIALFLIFFLVAKATWNVYGKESESRDKRDRAQTELASLQARQVRLTSEVEELKTDQGVEREIRENFSMTKEGEKLVVFVDERKDANLGEKKGVFHSIWDIFTSLFTK